MRLEDEDLSFEASKSFNLSTLSKSYLSNSGNKKSRNSRLNMQGSRQESEKPK